MALITSIQTARDPPSSRRTSSGDEKHPESWMDASIAVEADQRTQSRKDRLISFEELPAWHQDNPHIRHGYRPISRSTRACLRSWGFLHNETLNIYTHLIPAIAALFVGEAWVLTYLRQRYVGVAASDYVIFAFLLSAAAVCLGISSAYHTLMSHSREIEARWLRLDFVGIIVLIVGSFVSGIYVGFWCEWPERKIYWSMSASLGAVSIVIMLAPCFQGPKWRTFRLVVFVVTGLSGFAPIIHGIHMFGFAQMARQSGLPYYFAEGGLFLIGAITYAVSWRYMLSCRGSPQQFTGYEKTWRGVLILPQCRFPECIKPGAFDIFGSSHQIFHVLVVVATLIHLIGVLKAFDYNYHHRQCAW